METEIQESGYTIKTPIFEGPFAVLLNLIESKKLFINDLSLAEVTEDFLKYINTLKLDNSVSPEKQTEQISGFIVVAATLLLIKSKSLLPNLDLTDEEKGDIRDLEDRLKQYELYSHLSSHIKDNFGKNIIFAPLERKNDVLIFLPDERITPENMMIFAREVIGKIPKKVILQKVEVKKVVSIEEMIEKLIHRIQNSINLNFKDFAGNATTKEERVVVIVGFLAMLELARTGILNLVQENNFEDIFIEKKLQEDKEPESTVIENNNEE